MAVLAWMWSLGVLAAEPPASSSATAASGRISARADRASGTRLDPRVREYIVPTRIVWQSPQEQATVEQPEMLL
jgi:hypothetical protein